MTPLEEIIRQRIAAQGGLRVDEYMALALGHPQHGYYITRDPLGAAGDFTTAPEISQMFGELIGLWCAVIWQSMGNPTKVRLVELGPGRGTLMADLLRAAAMVPAFRAAVEVHLVETSPALRRRQRQALGEAVFWHDSLDGVPRGAPLLVIANEFFDALPIRQFERTSEGWRERLVGLAEDGELAFHSGPAVLPPGPLPETPEGKLAELCPEGRALATRLGRRLNIEGGAALIIDYGPARSGPGDSLQAVRAHKYAPVLDQPGQADLTAHVDFQALAASAAPWATAYGPVPQGAWLRALGIEQRAETLAKASGRALDVAAACRRLIHPSEMGTLFKVQTLAAPNLPPPPGFEEVPLQ